MRGQLRLAVGTCGMTEQRHMQHMQGEELVTASQELERSLPWRAGGR